MENKLNKLSILIIARNEEVDLPDCLDSVEWAKEVILINNGSTDKTVSIAKKHNVKVYDYNLLANEGHFAEIRNFASKKATGEWLLYLDADERVTPLLRREIETVIGFGYASFAIPRKNILLGHEMKHGGWWPDYVLRLIKKDKLHGWEGEVHEQPKIDGNVGKLKNPLTHVTHKNLSEMIDKTNNWSDIEAKLLYDSKHPPMNIIRFASAAFREFWYRAVKKAGFLDGVYGWIEIIYQVYSRLITYSKLWELQINKK